MGLVLNPSKSEVVCSSSEASDKLLRELPGACIVDPSKAVLLGSPKGDIDSICGYSEKDHFSSVDSERLVSFFKVAQLMLFCCGVTLSPVSHGHNRYYFILASHSDDMLFLHTQESEVSKL